MPKQHRWVIKRKIVQASKHLNSAGNILVDVGIEYVDIHPEIYAQISAIVAALMVVNNTLDALENRI